MQHDATKTTTMLTVTEVAHIMNVTEDVVRGWGRDGKFGAKKIGRSYHFPSTRLEMLTVDDVAMLLHVNDQTVRKWARDAVYPAIKIGRRYYFTRPTLLQAMAA